MTINKTKINQAAGFLKVISHPTRIEIIMMLDAKGELTVSQICTKLGVEQSLVSHHLASMRRKGVLEATRDGINIYYSIKAPVVLDIISKASVKLNAASKGNFKALRA
ncbi:MAG: winged helix-turn-helix transcriptional regulator [Bacteroidia bacterium]|nr:winged helix-turn-helix transcriptional regulator [Bacteroidia bacterium]